MKQNHILKYFLTLSIPCVLLLTAGCGSKVDNGGYVKEGDIKQEISVGKSTRDEVREKLGSPSSQSSFGPETWYYISDRKESTAFFAPEIVEQQVTSIEFDNTGMVTGVKDFSEKDSKEFAITKRATPTEGHSLGLFEQLLGNIGRFNRPTDNDSVAPGRHQN